MWGEDERPGSAQPREGRAKRETLGMSSVMLTGGCRGKTGLEASWGCITIRSNGL